VVFENKRVVAIPGMVESKATELRLAAELGIREYLQTTRGLRQFGSNAMVQTKDNHSFVVVDQRGERYRVIIRPAVSFIG
jgi:hypothetical protein